MESTINTEQKLKEFTKNALVKGINPDYRRSTQNFYTFSY
ncbi:hypothetical protein APHNP_0256 [Anaplasma phagocytophilum str. ApNP]|uniref:Uncharacterized protein n=1 Tax=Anaplasma phagocytophilum str. ApNP TaxID=1359153 RepID=A0A0F3NI08_ANAPH|nr:hypothetical protein APHNP_0256 [Anaplasma phagocytophilum str. ApNP]